MTSSGFPGIKYVHDVLPGGRDSASTGLCQSDLTSDGLVGSVGDTKHRRLQDCRSL
jgi:hypothetical protein